MKSLELDLDFEVEVNYDYEEGTPNYFDKMQEQHYPGDAPEVTILEATIMISAKAVQEALEEAEKNGNTNAFIPVNIKDSLTEKQEDAVMVACFEDKDH